MRSNGETKRFVLLIVSNLTRCIQRYCCVSIGTAVCGDGGSLVHHGYQKASVEYYCNYNPGCDCHTSEASKRPFPLRTKDSSDYDQEEDAALVPTDRKESLDEDGASFNPPPRTLNGIRLTVPD
ncbi:expressed unknown protein [Seminavis robusta]|uniref:Uncharacterized protein n=1 Tax=Seminavis robusta TaxID=568900 RepID=A0A9N8DB87_9STRA|nr:expressed unknown protein [Seminavis robusta]|eukprot:Sro21_g014821.1  (124) ;mRNA; f:112104-112475